MAETIRVLYVDDEPLLLDVGKQFLEQYGDFTVTTALSASEAIRILGQERFDAIVSDYQMPEMDGIEFLKHLKAEGNTTPFIIITGKGREEIVIEALNAGADGYLQKGGEPKSQFAELSQKINKAVKSRQTDEALRESEEKLRSLFQILPVGITILDKNRNIVNVNPALEQILSFSKDELMRGDHRQRRHIRSDGTPMLPEEYASSRAISEQTVVSGIETGVVKEDGSIIWTSVSAAPLTGDELSAVIVTTDITERKQAEEALWESEERYRTLVASVNEAIILQEKTGEILTWNRAAERLFGVTAKEVLGHTATSRKWKTIREDGTEFLDSEHPSMHTLATGEACKNVVMGITSNKGRFSWVNINTSPLFRQGDAKPYAVVISLLDVTERKQAVEAIQYSEIRFKELFKNMSNGVAVYNAVDDGADFVFVNFNRAAETIDKIKKEDIIGKRVSEVFPGIGEFGLQEVFCRVWRTGKSEQYPIMQYKDKRISGWRDNFIYRLPSGEIVAVYNDVTERKQAEDALRKSENRYRSLFEGVPIGLYRTTPSGQILDGNPALVRLLDYPDCESLLAVSVFDLYKNPGDRNQWLALIEREGIARDFEVQFRKYDGTFIWVRDTGEAVRDASGQVIYYNGNVEDITERKQDEAALRESEEKFRSLVEHALEGIMILDLQGTILFANNAMARTLETDGCAGLIGRNVMEFVAPESREDVVKDFIEVSHGHDAYLAQYNTISAKGKKITVESIGKVFSYKGKPADLVSIRDITERKQADIGIIKVNDCLISLGSDYASNTQRITALCGELLGASFALYNRIDQEELNVIASWNTPKNFPTTMSAANSLCSEVCHQNVDLLFLENLQDSPFAETIPSIRKFGIATYLGHIIRYKGIPVGTLCVLYTYPAVPSEAHKHLLGLLAAAIIVEEECLIANEALRESEERYHNVVEDQTELICRFLPNGTHVFVNEAYCRYFSKTREEIIGHRFKPVLHPEDQKSIARHFTSLTPLNPVMNINQRIIMPDGSTRWQRWSDRAIFHEDGSVKEYQSVGRDITDRKQDEEALRETNEYLHKLIDFGNAPIIVWNPEFEISLFNQASEHLTGRKEPEVIGQKIDILFPADSREASLALIKKTVEGKRWETVEIPILASDGTIRTVLWNTANILTAEAELTSTIAQGIDITGRKRIEEALRESEQRLTEAQRIGKIGDWEWIPAENKVIWGAEMYAIFGIAPETVSLTSEMTIQAFHPEDRAMVEEATRKTLEELKPQPIECRILKPDGTICYVSGHGEVVLDANGKLVKIIGIYQDITERKRAEDAIKSALAEKEVLLREIHHRVKNNLAGIISLIDLQIGSVSDPVTITLLKDLEARIRSMALVHESLYRTEDLTHISFTNYTEDLTRYLFQAYGTGTDIRCRIEMGDIAMPIETAIPCGLVMNEIVTNSLKYAFPHTFSCGESRREPCTITLSLHREGNDYLLTIADNGTGIPEGIDATMSHSLGLFLIRFIVEHQLRGSLEINTSGGTAYTIRFPAPEAKERNNDE